MSTRRRLLVTLTIGLFAFPSAARGGANPDFTVPLHALVGFATSCDDYLPVDCVTERPNVNVPANEFLTVFLFSMNQNNLGGLTTAFEWPAGWRLLGATWSCNVRQAIAETPTNPGGPFWGTLVTVFDCFTSQALSVIGYMAFASGTEGCLRQVNTTARGPFMVALLDCDFRVDLIDADDPSQQPRLGKICVAAGGHDACDPLATPVEPATWGKVKSSYRRQPLQPNGGLR